VDLTDALGIKRFIVAGQSTGGPYAVACAALLPERITGAVVLAGITDMAWSGAWSGHTQAEIDMMRMPDEASVAARCEQLFGTDGSGLFASSGIELPEPDAALFADEVTANAIMASLNEAFRQGLTGYAQDLFVQGKPWPFDPGTITAPVILAHGDLDTIIPIDHSRHSAELIPGSKLRILPGQGHIAISSALPGLCAELIQSLESDE
jgi:pimeloyl-ACP methyl ester carboxylesterase